MTKKYTITGSSTTRPTGLPEGFEVEETEEGFDRIIPADSSEEFTIRVHDRDGDGEPRISFPNGSDGMYFNRQGVVALRDALTELIGDGPKAGPPAVVNLGDPEPSHDAVYTEQDGDEWGYSGGSWCFRSDPTEGWTRAYRGADGWDEVQRVWPETFPWKLKTS